LSLTSSSRTLTSATANTGSASSSLAAASSCTSASTSASSSALTHTLTHTLIHACMARYRRGGDFREFTPLEFFHDISDASRTLVLINIDLGRREGLHGIGADVPCNQSCSALPGHFLGGLYAGTAGCHDIGVGNRILAHAVQVNYHEKWAPPKPGIHGSIKT
jgi:hypothetical protein